MGDERFKALNTDPRYRLPSRKQAQTAVDPRFSRLFTDEGFTKKASVDRYGRTVKDDRGKKDLHKRFRLEDEARPAKVRPSNAIDTLVASASDADSSEDEAALDEEHKVRDPARDGFSGSSSEEESTSESEDEGEDTDENDLAEETAGNEQTEEVPLGEVSRRIAVVNLDWDNIRAADILAVAQSFVPTGGRIEKVVVYPSEFGRERLEMEELEGPPREIFASSKRLAQSDEEDDEDEDERIKTRLLQEQASEGEEFDTAKLRQYQLERLRYYYAVVTCGNEVIAKALYDNMDGREYLSTANFFDMRFIPDETSFDDDEPRDESSKLPEGYKPNDFRTEALTHSKVRLTWDDDDTTRKEVQKRAFSRAEMDENDLKAYIGSDSSDAESDAPQPSTAEDAKAKQHDAARAKMRNAFGLPEAPSKAARRKSDEPVGDMQITFSAGLSSNQNGKGVFENEPQDEESTRDRYIRKERERRQKRKDKMKSARSGDADTDDVEPEGKEDAVAKQDDGDDDEQDPFDHPFFNDPAAAAAEVVAARKADKRKKQETKAAEAEAAASRRAELELLMAEDEKDAVRHFNMKEIEKAEKDARRKKGKKAKKQSEAAAASIEADAFKLETEDPRFKALFESHDFAIDPTNPRFKGTEGMKALLEEGRRKRKAGDAEIDDVQDSVGKKNKFKTRQAGAGKDDLKGLVARLKTRNKNK